MMPKNTGKSFVEKIKYFTKIKNPLMTISKITVLFLISLLTILSAKGQDLQVFKRGLQAFRYSMYVELSGMDYEALKNDSVFVKNGIDKKIANFINQYSTEIHLYKSETLRKYLSEDRSLPDLQIYEMNTSQSDLSVYEDYPWGKEFWSYTKIELIEYIGIMTMSIQSRYLETSKIAEIAYKNALARPLIFTQEKQSDL